MESARIAAWMQLRDYGDSPDVAIGADAVYPCDVNAEVVALSTTLLPTRTVPENTHTAQERTEAALAAIVAVWADAGITPTDPVPAEPGSTIRFAVPEGGEATLGIGEEWVDMTLRTACIAVE